jgi:hypothetical protein
MLAPSFESEDCARPNNAKKEAGFGTEGFSLIEIKSEINRRHDEEKGDDMVPARYLPEQLAGT